MLVVHTTDVTNWKEWTDVILMWKRIFTVPTEKGRTHKMDANLALLLTFLKETDSLAIRALILQSYVQTVGSVPDDVYESEIRPLLERKEDHT